MSTEFWLNVFAQINTTIQFQSENKLIIRMDWQCILATDALFYKKCIKINRPSFYLVCYRIEFCLLYLRSVSCCVAKTTQASMCESTALIGIFYCQHSHIAYAWCSSTALFVLQILIPVLVCCSVQLIWFTWYWLHWHVYRYVYRYPMCLCWFR